MTNRLKSRFLMTTAALLAGVSLASAQGPIGGAGGGAGSEKRMSPSATGASRSEGMTQGRATESRESGRAEESGRAQRDEVLRGGIVRAVHTVPRRHRESGRSDGGAEMESAPARGTLRRHG